MEENANSDVSDLAMTLTSDITSTLSDKILAKDSCVRVVSLLRHKQHKAPTHPSDTARRRAKIDAYRTMHTMMYSYRFINSIEVQALRA